MNRTAPETATDRGEPFAGKHRKARVLRFQARHLSRKALARKKARRRMTTESRRRNR